MLSLGKLHMWLSNASHTGHHWQNIIYVVRETLFTTRYSRLVMSIVQWRHVGNAAVLILLLVETVLLAGDAASSTFWYHTLLLWSCDMVTQSHCFHNSVTYWLVRAAKWRNDAVRRVVDVIANVHCCIWQQGVVCALTFSSFSCNCMASYVIRAARDLVRRFNLDLGRDVDRLWCRSTLNVTPLAWPLYTMTTLSVKRCNMYSLY